MALANDSDRTMTSCLLNGQESEVYKLNIHDSIHKQFRTETSRLLNLCVPLLTAAATYS